MNSTGEEQAPRERVTTGAWLGVVGAYGTALVAAVAMVAPMMHLHPVWVAAIAGLTATLAVFLLSFTFDNTSLFDPYWSVVPMAIALFWSLDDPSPDVNATRQLLAGSLVAAWGLRLTWNWARGWGGMGHEDWRYADWRGKAGAFYWPVSFVAFHLIPSVQIFLGSLALYPVLARSDAPLGGLDLLATLVTAGAIAIEAGADEQLRRFARSGSEGEPGAILHTGLWAWCRHPNYFGEVMFWWGLYLFGLAADPSWWWTLIGPLSITAMFVFGSIPMIEERMLERRPRYAEIQKSTPALLPRPPSRGARG